MSVELIRISVNAGRELEQKIEALVSMTAFSLLEEYGDSLPEGAHSSLIETFSNLKAEVNDAVDHQLREQRQQLEELWKTQIKKED